MIKQFKIFTKSAFKENNVSLKNIKLLLKSLIQTIESVLRRERIMASEVYSYESLFFIKKRTNAIAFLESCRKNDNAFPSGIIGEVQKLKELFNVDKLNVFEIGSGPNSNLSYWVDKGLLRVQAIDPLADVYKSIMQKLNYNYPIAPIKLKGEETLKFFKKNTFHLVFAQNSLDHTEDPIKCFKNAYKLLKKGGLLFICSNVREGSRKSWIGMHKFDLYIEDNALFLANQQGQVRKFIDKNVMSLDFIFYETYNRYNVPSFEAVFKKI